ncbi:hypothetical protein ACHAXH_004855 [Discostella pseudostelligera]|jgi:putative SOS response-associated peptidase YedK
MCGRTAYSARSINIAAAAFDSSTRPSSKDAYDSFADAKPSPSPSTQSRINRLVPSEETNRPNAGPGSTMHIFRCSRKSEGGNNLELCTGVWGLIPNNGSQPAPHLLPSDPKFSKTPHYKMFNARSETIYDKRSFSGLIRNGQTCILAVEGYYEWTKSSSSSDKRKQPYFVCTKDKNQPLLLAGLWSSVKTGPQVTDSEEAEMLTTFTILTMDAYPDNQWLHPRQPVLIWDISIALKWLLQPTHMALKNLLRSLPIGETELAVYPVSKMINDGKYQGEDCTVEVKLETAPSLKSYFSPTKKAKTGMIVEGNSDRKVSNTLGFSPTESKGQITKKRPHSKSSDITNNEPSHEDSAPTSYFSPKKSDPVSSVEESSDSELPSELHCKSSVRPQGKGEMAEELSHSKSTEINYPDNERTWACSQCTFINNGAIKWNYLACEVCGSPRTITEEIGSDDESGRERKTIS